MQGSLLAARCPFTPVAPWPGGSHPLFRCPCGQEYKGKGRVNVVLPGPNEGSLFSKPLLVYTRQHVDEVRPGLDVRHSERATPNAHTRPSPLTVGGGGGV